MSIEEQAAALLADGLALAGPGPRLSVVSTFAAFFEGIAREGFDLWRYQRNLTGVNEGLNVAFHLSHVGACTGRDHFSGWGLDWINVGLTYLPYLHRFYAPADARAAFVAVLDLAAHYGGHVIGIPRDNLPILDRPDGSGPLWEADSPWEAVTAYRVTPGARRAILAFGAPAFLAGEAAARLLAEGMPVDVQIVNGLPLPGDALIELVGRYPEGVVTVEDGLIGCPQSGVRGFAGVVAAATRSQGVPAAHLGITDPRVAPSDGHLETWAHFGLTAEALVAAVKGLR
jgi:transketolase C-terminal domain/subunit